jgi:hypothetical protein
MSTTKRLARLFDDRHGVDIVLPTDLPVLRRKYKNYWLSWLENQILSPEGTKEKTP